MENVAAQVDEGAELSWQGESRGGREREKDGWRDKASATTLSSPLMFQRLIASASCCLVRTINQSLSKGDLAQRLTTSTLCTRSYTIMGLVLSADACWLMTDHPILLSLTPNNSFSFNRPFGSTDSCLSAKTKSASSNPDEGIIPAATFGWHTDNHSPRWTP